MKRSFVLLVMTVFSSICVAAATSQPAPPVVTPTTAPTSPTAGVNRLAEALATVGLTEDDMGIRPQGYWSRYPHRVPYKMHFYDSLFAEPLRIYQFTHMMAEAVKENLAPLAYQKDAGSLYRGLFYLGIDHKIGGFRAFGANLDPDLPEKNPLLWAAKGAYDAAGQRMRTIIFSGVWPGKKVDWPDPEADIIKQTADLDPRLERIVADLLANVVEAYRWRQLALRNVDGKLLHDIFRIRGFSGHSSNSQGYLHQVDDLMKTLDEESLYYGAQKAVQATQDAARQLKALVDKEPDKFLKVNVDFPTPIGRVVVSGTGKDRHTGESYAVLIDLGGDDVYEGGIGATSSLDNPISVAIDLGGNDVYRVQNDSQLSQGAGVFGVGVLMNLEGDDVYEGGTGCQGYGCFGLGMIIDYSGEDKYSAGHAAQGAGYFGIGLCMDATGNDVYYALGDCQGFGGPGGVGVLADAAGNDTYTAEPLASKAGRPDYHSKLRLTTSSAQGCGSGVRADGSNGHAWAGGLGALVDLDGNDKYEAANFAIGCGYWLGTGILYDGGGNDSYHSACYSLASGCHFGISAVIDESGNDRYTTDDDCEVAIASGRDYQVSLLLDRQGDDYYQGPSRCVNFSEVRSTALLLDLAGNDTYLSADSDNSLAAAKFDPSYAKPTYRSNPSGAFGNGLAVLLDIGGNNKFISRNFKTNEDSPSATAGNGRTFYKPAKDTPTYGYRNFGIGTSVPDGTVHELLLKPAP